MSNLLIDALMIVAVVVIGYVAGQLIDKLKLPKVLGFLIVGMLIGPYAIGLIDKEFFQSPLVITVALVALGFVGYAIGSSIHMDVLKRAGAKMFVMTLFVAYLPFLFVSLVFYYVLQFDLMVSLIAGAIALPTAPAVAISIIQQYRTKGSLTQTVLVVTVIDDVLAVVTFGIIMSFAGAYYGGHEITFIEPFLEILKSVALGAGVGLVGWVLMRKIYSRWKLQIVSIIVVFAAMLIGYLADIELFITGIIFGIVLFNLFKKEQQESFAKANIPIIWIGVIFFLVLIGATLDITALLTITALAAGVIYIVARGAGKLLGAYLGARIVKAEPNVVRYLGFTLLAAAGVSLTFVGIATGVLPPEQSSQLSAIIAVAALINEFIAVFLTKWGLQKANELHD